MTVLSVCRDNGQLVATNSKGCYMSVWEIVCIRTTRMNSWGIIKNYSMRLFLYRKIVKSRRVFYDFPDRYWQSIQTSNPMESTFDSIRHRTWSTNVCLLRNVLFHMMSKLRQCVEKKWKKFTGLNYLTKIFQGI